jgi:hypothetical protein
MEEIMNNRIRLGAEAWPISRPGPGHRPILEKVIIKSHHPDGNGVLHLTPDQALYFHSRLSHVNSAFLRSNHLAYERYGVPELPPDHLSQMSRCGAKVWPISHETDALPPALDKVVVENENDNRHHLLNLSPEQAEYIHARLTHINLAFLHENAWGGEDASGL